MAVPVTAFLLKSAAACCPGPVPAAAVTKPLPGLVNISKVVVQLLQVLLQLLLKILLLLLLSTSYWAPGAFSALKSSAISQLKLLLLLLLLWPAQVR
jgi:hypothetical protein